MSAATISNTAIKDAVDGGGGANIVETSISYNNNDGSTCKPCDLCEGSVLNNLFNPKSPALCISCASDMKTCNQVVVTTSFKTPWAMTYTSLTSHSDGGGASLDPQAISIHASNNYNKVSKIGQWRTLLTISSSAIFEERNKPKDLVLDNDTNTSYKDYRITYSLKNDSKMMKIGHYGLIQSYVQTYTAQIFKNITGIEVKGLPTREPTAAPTGSPTTAVPTDSPTTAAPTPFPTDSPTTAVPTPFPTDSPTTAAPTPSPTGIHNLALVGTAKQSSTWNGFAASKAIDGNTNGNLWGKPSSVTHTNWDKNAWWSVQLRKKAVITKIVVWNRTDADSGRLTNSAVKIYNNGAFATQKIIGLSTNKAKFEFDFGKVVGDKVVVQDVGTTVLTIAEVQVFGYYS